MGIILIIVIATLIIAGIGAAVYLLVFRAKHKKEVLENSQYNMPNDLPVYGGQNTSGQIPNISDTNPMAQGNSPMMNDIVGVQPQQSAMNTPEMPQPPVAPLQSQEQPMVNHDFPSADFAPNIPEASQTSNLESSDISKDNPLEANLTGSLMDDQPQSSSVNSMAETSMVDDSVDSSIDDATVPVMKENESLSQEEAEINDAEISGPEPIIAESAATQTNMSQDVPTENSVSVPETTYVPEVNSGVQAQVSDLTPPATPVADLAQSSVQTTPQASEPTSDTVVTPLISDQPPIPQSAGAVPNPVSDENSAGQEDQAKEMHI